MCSTWLILTWMPRNPRRPANPIPLQHQPFPWCLGIIQFRALGYREGIETGRNPRLPKCGWSARRDTISSLRPSSGGTTIGRAPRPSPVLTACGGSTRARSCDSPRRANRLKWKAGNRALRAGGDERAWKALPGGVCITSSRRRNAVATGLWSAAAPPAKKHPDFCPASHAA